jgi:vancomycin permeability regulator SanA
MIRRLFKWTLSLAIFALVAGLCTAAWLVYDGLTDTGDRADIAVVPGMTVAQDGTPGPSLQTRLDGAIERYKQGHFPLIFVSGGSKPGGYDEADGMAKYLIAHEVPADAIVEDHHGDTTADTARNLARYMKRKDIHSAMIVTHYYHITRMKLALSEAGITDIGQSHVGALQKEDAGVLAREVAAFYYYLARYYLLPEAKDLEKDVQEEAPKVQDELKQDADKAKQTVDDKLKSLPK